MRAGYPVRAAAGEWADGDGGFHQRVGLRRGRSHLNRPNDSDFNSPGSRESQRGVIRPPAGARGERKVQGSKDVGLTLAARNRLAALGSRTTNGIGSVRSMRARRSLPVTVPRLGPPASTPRAACRGGVGGGGRGSRAAERMPDLLDRRARLHASGHGRESPGREAGAFQRMITAS